MALGFTVNVYGTVNQNPPYAADNNGLLPAVEATYASAKVLPTNFATADVELWSVNPGVKMAGGVFCYGVIEVPAGGLQQFSKKYIVKETIAVLATLRG